MVAHCLASVGSRLIPSNARGGKVHQSITDLVEFFTGGSVEFPRVRLPGVCLFKQEYDANVRLFCGLADEEMEQYDVATLHQMTSQLAPWIDKSRANRSMELSITSLQPVQMSGLRAERTDRKLVPVLAQLCRDIEANVRLEQRLIVTELAFVSGKQLVIDDELDEFEQLMRTHALNIGHVEVSFHDSDCRPRLASFVRHLSGLQGHAVSGKIDTAALGIAWPLPVVASCLPFTSAVATVKVSSYQFGQDLDNQVYAWLGYALFHPDTFIDLETIASDGLHDQ